MADQRESMPASQDEEEDRRLQALYALNLLDSEPEKEFESLVALAAQLLDCPIAMLTLIDRDRLWVKARIGAGDCPTARNGAICDRTIRSAQPMIVPDLALDPRFADNVLVADAPFLRFYAGVPIHATDAGGVAHAIGAVCAVDTRAHALTGGQADALRHLGALADALIAARSAARAAMASAEAARDQTRALGRTSRTLRQVERMAAIGSWSYDLADETVSWSDGVRRIYGLEPSFMPTLLTALDQYPPHSRAAISGALAQTIDTGAPFEIDLDFLTAHGAARRVRAVGELEVAHGRPVAVIGVFQDITEQYQIERTLRESASIDEVTRIANRAAFNRTLAGALDELHGEGKPLTLILLDIDTFKQTNDSHGHLAGDDVLRAVGQRLQAPYLNESFAARLGGDEFAVLLRDPALIADQSRIIRRLLRDLKLPVRSRGQMIEVSATIGWARASPEAGTIRDLLHAADTALYSAKRACRGSARAYPVRAAA